MRYENAVTLLASGRNGSRVIGNNTRLHRIDAETIAVKLHNTDIVLIHSSGRYTLDAGGWHTVTTKARMNEFSPAKIGQTKGIWYVSGFLYRDGMQVDVEGNPINPIKPDATESSKKKLDKAVSKYIKGYVKNAIDGKGLTPPSGDCFGCSMRPVDADRLHPEHNQPMGFSHFFDHFAESYYVPSLLINAVVSHGYMNAELILGMINDDVERGNGKSVARELQGYFRKLKPALLKEMNA